MARRFFYCSGVQKLNGYVMNVLFVGHIIRTVQMNLSSFLAHSPNCSKKLEKCSIRSAFSFPELRVPERLQSATLMFVCMRQCLKRAMTPRASMFSARPSGLLWERPEDTDASLQLRLRLRLRLSGSASGSGSRLWAQALRD